MSTSTDIINAVETYLAQTTAMIVAGLPSGGGENDVYTITSNNQLLLWATEGQNRLARLCLPVPDTATFTPATSGQSSVPFTQIVSGSGRVLISPSQVSIGSRNLVTANMGFLMGNNNWYPTLPDGTPTGWADNNSGITLSAYTGQPTFTATGYFLPAPLTILGQTLDSYIDDYAMRTIAFYVAWMVCGKNLNNTVLAERLVPMGNEWVGGVKEMYARLIQEDPTMAAFYPLEPINSLVQVTGQVKART